MSAASTQLQASEADRRGLQRLQWGVRAVLMLGVAASVAANVLHADSNLISQLIAAWPPLALLLTVELISRVPADQRGLATVRLITAFVIAGIAAWVSYWHMVGVAAHYGEDSAHANYLLPLSVDGLVVVASISLLEIAGRLARPAATPSPTGTSCASPASGGGRQSHALATGAPLRTVDPAPAAAATSPYTQADVPVVEVLDHILAKGHVRPAPGRQPLTQPDNHRTDSEAIQTAEPPAAVGDDKASGARKPDAVSGGTRLSENADSAIPTGAAAAVAYGRHLDSGKHRADQPAHPANDSGAVLRLDSTERLRPGASDNGGQKRLVPADTRTAVAFWYQRDPAMHPSEIAAKIGRSERTVRRYWPPSTGNNGPAAQQLSGG